MKIDEIQQDEPLVRKFRITEANLGSPAEVLGLKDVIPALWDKSPEDSEKVCLVREVKQSENELYGWDVTVKYGDPPASGR